VSTALRHRLPYRRCAAPQARETPARSIPRVEHLTDVVIASFAGGPKNPPWRHNLIANPEATVELGSERFRVKAAVTTGEERQRLFNRQTEQMSIFADYEKKTARQIPVLVLTRIG